ncbi:HEL251Cp [Eremothecium sinecaudum]|uniref:HEL251Cp n=1 Tax=Eremothecium sinecaudum TaxID=45286 RepID=A0A109UZ81_9SACH|nr:HEL251Cp [Eremothecium sinecaudum]AMD21030.1 HEL251Cp [Eremothecium sinecaudum]
MSDYLHENKANVKSRKHVVTQAEKKARILRFFQENHDIYSMKDLEKIIPKKCAGVSSMLVKDLVQQLIDEQGIISVEKCGNVNVYWCFKNQLVGKIHKEMKAVEASIDDTKAKIKALEADLHIQNKEERCDHFDHQHVRYKRTELLAKNEKLRKELAAIVGNYNTIEQTKWDQTTIEDRLKGLKQKLEQLDKITDNIEVNVSLLMRKYSLQRKEVTTALEIPHDFDDFDEFESIRKLI